MSKTTCPVFRPTLSEFQNFSKYIKYIEDEKDAFEAGICKVIPPQGWFHREYDIEGELGDFVVGVPTKQEVSCNKGAFTLNHMIQKPMTCKDIYQYAMDERNSYVNDNWDERELQFWRSMQHSRKPLYGADTEGSLFEGDPACGWNVNHLDTPLKLLPKKPAGVCNSMLYFGTWRAMFAFHTEDGELYSINYLHTGAAKSWYSIPLANKQRFESITESYFATEKRNCPEYLRHKTHMFSPKRMKESGVSYNEVLQEAGEFVITFPGAYHAGFNHGFNIAESTNFVSDRWIPLGLKANVCKCRPEPVNVDFLMLETLIYRENKRKNTQQEKECVSVTDVESHGSQDGTESEEGDSSWLLRCSCTGDDGEYTRREYAAFDSDRSSAVLLRTEKSSLQTYKQVYEGLLFMCSECECWCHVGCIFGKQIAPSDLPKDATCHICKQLNDFVEGEGGLVKKRKQRRQEGGSSCSSRVTVKVGDAVQARVPLRGSLGAECRSIVGEVKEISGRGDDICGGSFFRLHVKGTPKATDYWINIRDFGSYSHFIESSSSKSAKKAGQSKIQKKRLVAPPTVLEHSLEPKDNKRQRPSSKKLIGAHYNSSTDNSDVTTDSYRQQLMTTFEEEESSNDCLSAANSKQTPPPSHSGALNDDAGGTRLTGRDPILSQKTKEIVNSIQNSHMRCVARQEKLFQGCSGAQVEGGNVDAPEIDNHFPLYTEECSRLFEETLKCCLMKELNQIFETHCEGSDVVRDFLENIEGVFSARSSALKSSRAFNSFFYEEFSYSLENYLTVLSEGAAALPRHATKINTIVLFLSQMSLLSKLDAIEGSISDVMSKFSELVTNAKSHKKHGDSICIP